MMSKSTDVTFRLGLDRFQEGWEDWVDAACKHDWSRKYQLECHKLGKQGSRTRKTRRTVLPDKDAKLIAQTVKHVGFEHSTSPYPDHILIPLDLRRVSVSYTSQKPRQRTMSSSHRLYRSRVPEGRTISIGIQLFPILPYSVRMQAGNLFTTHEDPLVIDLEEERCAFLPVNWLLDEFGTTESDLAIEGVEYAPVLAESHYEHRKTWSVVTRACSPRQEAPL